VKSETLLIKDLFYALGRNEKKELLYNSNLNDKEIRIMEMRHIEGLSIKEISEVLNIDIDTYNQSQKRINKKLYSWLTDKINYKYISNYAHIIN